MVVLHGVHHLGMDEPRLIAFAAGIASCGLRVLTPELPGIKDYQVSADSIRTIGDSAAWMAVQNPNGERRPVGVMGLSFSGGLSLLVTLGLVTLSCYLLKMSWSDVAFFGAVVTVMTFALNGLAVGLGVLFPNVKETNPNKIVSGFGGTLCLVLSFLYIVGSVTLLALGSPWGWHGDASASWILTTWVSFGLFSIVIGWVPYRLGLRREKVLA